ncbi:hypothetical protein MRX96_009695 [Rhipicephalus microplus]
MKATVGSPWGCAAPQGLLLASTEVATWSKKEEGGLGWSACRLTAAASANVSPPNAATTASPLPTDSKRGRRDTKSMRDTTSGLDPEQVICVRNSKRVVANQKVYETKKTSKGTRKAAEGGGRL